MAEPHVRTLIYRPVIPADADYDAAPPLATETERVRLDLTHDRLVVQLKGDPLPQCEARAVAEDVLRAWEVGIGLVHGPGHLAFEFVQAEPETPAAESNGLEPAPDETIVLLEDARVRTVYNDFPHPPHRFRLSPETEMMYQRYRLYRQGRESLIGAAYWCLAVLEYSARGRAEAADQYRLDPKVLRKLGELCRQRGMANGRQAHHASPQLKPGEREWVRAVTRRLILRAGEYAFDPVSKLPLIAMADFPALP